MLKILLLACICLYAALLFGLVYLRWFPPLTTAVQVQRRIESWFAKGTYQKRIQRVPLEGISLSLRHAVIAAEDGRFYQHHGIDFEEMKIVLEESQREGEMTRGGSTISQQLVKNLFFTTRGSLVRKAAEYATVPAAELILGKQRILELYLNEIEWGPGVFGAEAASQYHFKTSAARLSREQSARLAAVIPSPLRRRPARMNQYAEVIMNRMSSMGW